MSKSKFPTRLGIQFEFLMSKTELFTLVDCDIKMLDYDASSSAQVDRSLHYAETASLTSILKCF